MPSSLSSTGRMPTVLYIDDEAGNRVAFQAAFRKDFTVLLAADLDAAWEHLREHEVHVVICDQRMPGVLGSEALARIRAAYPHVRRMLITAHADLQALVAALNEAGVPCARVQTLDQGLEAALAADPGLVQAVGSHPSLRVMGLPFRLCGRRGETTSLPDYPG